VTDNIQRIREQEILFSKNSLLTHFAPVVSHICASTKIFEVFFLFKNTKKKKKN